TGRQSTGMHQPTARQPRLPEPLQKATDPADGLLVARAGQRLAKQTVMTRHRSRPPSRRKSNRNSILQAPPTSPRNRARRPRGYSPNLVHRRNRRSQERPSAQSTKRSNYPTPPVANSGRGGLSIQAPQDLRKEMPMRQQWRRCQEQARK